MISILHSLDTAGVPELLARCLPLYESGYGWLLVAAALLPVSLLLHRLLPKKP